MLVKLAIGEPGRRPIWNGKIALRPSGRLGGETQGCAAVDGPFPPGSRLWLWLSPFRHFTALSDTLHSPQAAASGAFLHHFPSEDGTLYATLRVNSDEFCLDVEVYPLVPGPSEPLVRYEVQDGGGNMLRQGFLGLHPSQDERLSASARIGADISKDLEEFRLSVMAIGRADVRREDRADIERSIDATEHPDSKKVLHDILLQL